MAIKQNRWPAVLVVFVLFCAAIAFMWMKVLPQDVAVRDAVLAYLNDRFQKDGMKEGEDYNIGDIKILFSDETRAVTETVLRPADFLVHHEVLRLGSKWTVSKDLFEDFVAYMAIEANERSLIEHLGDKISKRYPDLPWTIKPGLKKEFLVWHNDGKLFGQVAMNFVYPKTEQGQQHGRYEELFSFQDGAWVSEGGGKLLDRAPPRKK